MKKEIFKSKEFHLFLKLIKSIPKGNYNFKHFIPYSYGVILYKKEKEHISYLFCQRRYTNEYITLISGKYSMFQLYDIFCLMTEKEKQNLLRYEFNDLWNDLFNTYKNFAKAKAKFEMLKPYIAELLSYSTSFCQNEWEFPKGKKIGMETPIQTAKREFKEEIGISIDHLHPKNENGVKEIVYGTDGNCYTTFYYLFEWKEEKFYANPSLKRLGETILNEEIKTFQWVQISNQDYEEDFQKLSHCVLDQRTNIVYNIHYLLQKDKFYYIGIRNLFHPKSEEDTSHFNFKKSKKNGNIII